MPGQGVGNVANVGASLEPREVRKSFGIAKDRSGKSRRVIAAGALFPARALHRLPPRVCSPKI
jgi:hypothetical protein